MTQKKKQLIKFNNRKISPWTFHRPITNKQTTFNASEGMPTNPPETARKIAIHSYTTNSWEFSGHSNQNTQLNQRSTQQIQIPNCNHPEDTEEDNNTNNLLKLDNKQISQIINNATTQSLQTGIDGSQKKNKLTCS